jgi:hypothetical protein
MTGTPTGPDPGQLAPADLGAELNNIPEAALPSILLFMMMALLYVLLLGPGNFLALRALHRPELMWVTVPVLSLLFGGTTLGLALKLKGSAVYLNSINVVQLADRGGTEPATVYVGLFAPVSGDYHLSSSTASINEAIPQIWNPDAMASTQRLGYQFDAGGVTLPSMGMWTMRNVRLRTTVHVQGGIQSSLHVAPDGSLIGTIRNTTNMPLIHPIVFAAGRATHLRDLPPGASRTVRIPVYSKAHSGNLTDVWYRAYHVSPYLAVYSAFRSVYSGPVPYAVGGPAPSCCASHLPAEHSLIDRIRNAAGTLPDAAQVVGTYPVSIAAWNTSGLGNLQVNGSTPVRRSLNVFVAPLPVHLSKGSFALGPGTVFPEVLSVVPQAPFGACCSQAFTGRSLVFGPGGGATVRWTLPAHGPIDLYRISLSLNAAGGPTHDIGALFDWRMKRWVPVVLDGRAMTASPGRFLSAQHQVLLRMQATTHTGDIRIASPSRDIQLSVSGVVR